MKSIFDLLSTITSIPFIDAYTKVRAAHLKKLLGGNDLGSIFGGAR